MSNIIGYVKNNKSTFKEEGLSDVDALVLSWLSYFNFTDKLKGQTILKISDIKGEDILPKKEMYKDAFLPRSSQKIFNLMMLSPRYSSLVISDFKSVRDEKDSMQFAALTICLNPELYFISFRGTDPSFIGWEEDFKLSYMPFTPSQKEGEEYVRSEMAKHPNCHFILGGHSKGGNVAIYAGAFLNKEEQMRIETIYSFDGPGFPPSFFKEKGYLSIKDKIKKILPPSSFVGVLFTNEYPYKIAKSRTFLFLQHNPFSFSIKGDSFIYRKKRTFFSFRSEFIMNSWIYMMTDEEKERYIRIIFTALNKLKIKDFNSFFYTLPKQVFHLFRIYLKVDKADRSFFVKKTIIPIKLFFTRRNKKIKAQ